LPQLSVPIFVPHSAPSREQNAGSVSGVQHWLPAVQTSFWLQLPQLPEVRCVPQLSIPDTVPHVALKRAQNAGLLSARQPQWFGLPPPPHVLPVPEQVSGPQTRLPPQLVVILPQSAPAHVVVTVQSQ